MSWVRHISLLLHEIFWKNDLTCGIGIGQKDELSLGE